MTIKIYLKQKGESLKTVILEDVRSVSTDGEFYRFEKYGKAPATVYKRENVAYWRYVAPKTGAAADPEGGANDAED